MRVRFQADADLNLAVLFGLQRREPSIDFQTAVVAELANRHDLEVLQIAAAEGRLLVTHDQKTMPGHFAMFVGQRESAGVIIVPQHLPVAAVIDDLMLVWGASDADEWINQIRYLPL